MSKLVFYQSLLMTISVLSRVRHGLLLQHPCGPRTSQDGAAGCCWLGLVGIAIALRKSAALDEIRSEVITANCEFSSELKANKQKNHANSQCAP